MLRERARTPPDDAGVWTARKVAAVMASALGLVPVAPARAAGRRCAPSAGPSGARADRCGPPAPTPAPTGRRHSEKTCRNRRAGGRTHPPGGHRAPSEPAPPTRTASGHRIGLKPITRRIWAPRGNRPVAPRHHRFEWPCATAFVAPATGGNCRSSRERRRQGPLRRTPRAVRPGGRGGARAHHHARAGGCRRAGRPRPRDARRRPPRPPAAPHAGPAPRRDPPGPCGSVQNLSHFFSGDGSVG